MTTHEKAYDDGNGYEFECDAEPNDTLGIKVSEEHDVEVEARSFGDRAFICLSPEKAVRLAHRLLELALAAVEAEAKR